MTKCKKRRYRDELDAKLAMSRIDLADQRRNRPKSEKRGYHCPACKGWHLTSKE